MGHVPIVPVPLGPFVIDADGQRLYARAVPGYERDLRHRGSRFGWRRRRAYRACLWLIRYREAMLAPAPKVMGAGAIVAPPKPSDAARSVRPAYVTGATGVVGPPGRMGMTGATGPSFALMGATGPAYTAGMVTGGGGCTVCMPAPRQSQFPRPRMVEIGSGEEIVELVDGDGRRWLVPVDSDHVGSHVTAKPTLPPANPSNRKAPADSSPFRTPPIQER